MLKPFVKHLGEMGLGEENIVDAIGKDMTHDFCVKATRIITTLFQMVEDCRKDIDAMKEANQHGKH